MTAAVDQAIALVRARQFGEAEALLREVLARDPGHAEGWSTLGNALFGQGREPEARDAYERALKAQPGFYKPLNNLANLCRQSGEHERAVELYRQAIDAQPDAFRAHANIAASLFPLARFAEAATSLREALRLLGVTVGQPDQAGSPAQSSGPYAPSLLLLRLGEAELACGRWDAAALAFHHAEQTDPATAVLALVGRGRASAGLGMLDEAIELLEVATAGAPGVTPASAQLGELLVQKAGQAGMNAGEARALNERACELLTAAIDAQGVSASTIAMRHALGMAHLGAGRAAAGIDALEQLCEEHPYAVEVAANLANALIIRGRADEAVDVLRRSLAARPLGPECDKAHANLCLALQYVSDATSVEETYEEHLRWAARFADGWTAVSAPPTVRRLDATRGTDPARKLRVGFVTSDARSHSVAYFLEPILRHFDRARIECVVYASVPNPDSTTARWADIEGIQLKLVASLSDRDLAAAIRQDEIDIAIDLNGHTDGSRLLALARRPAPLQLSYLGYPDTTGMVAMDGRMTDDVADPPGADSFARERLIRMPGGAWCFGELDELPPVVTDAATERAQRGEVVFGSFNNLAKVGAPVIEAWASILRKVPQSRLLLKAGGLDDEDARTAFVARCRRAGIDERRLDLVGRLPERKDHLARYGAVDIALDTFPYNGTTTTCEALAMGVPVVALRGARHAGRVGASLLRRVELDAMVADSIDEYVERAVALAGDQQRRSALRSSLRASMAASTLGDAERFGRVFTDELVAAWKMRCTEPVLGPRQMARHALYAEPHHVRDAMLCAGGQSPADACGSLSVCVPSGIDAITTYVLREQLGWFEEEAWFVPRLVRPGDGAIDIGANYGVYALPLSQAVGPAGHVWAFEPAPATAGYLRASAEHNQLSQLEIFEQAVADAKAVEEGAGRASFVVSPDAELNALGVHVDAASFSFGDRVEVGLTSLDEARRAGAFSSHRIRFAKIDAEGAEAAILRGAEALFQDHDPVLMLERVHAGQRSQALVEALEHRKRGGAGVAVLRLLPGLGLLVPHDEESTADGAGPLNVFVASSDRLVELVGAGLAVLAAPEASPPAPAGKADLARVMDHLRHAQSSQRSAADRLEHFEHARRIVAMLVAEDDSIEASLAQVRLAVIAGERRTAWVRAAELLQDDRLRGLRRRPAVVPSADLALPIGGGRIDWASWTTSALLAVIERTSAYSSFYNPEATIERARAMEEQGYCPDWMHHRRELAVELVRVLERAGVRVAPDEASARSSW